jgi:hypothetical protein
MGRSWWSSITSRGASMTFIVDGTNGLTFNNSTTQASAGVVLQVVNATYGTQTSSSSASFADTGLTATITPKFTTSKILVIVDQSCSNGGSSDGIQVNLLRASTVLTNMGVRISGTGANNINIGSASVTYLDSPATTSATTYKTQFNNVAASSTVYVQIYSSVSTITLMEIAG